MNKRSIATVSLSGTLEEKLKAIAAAGFDGVEIFETDFLCFDGSPADLRAMAADHGLEIVCYQPFRDFEGMPEPQRSRNFDRAERKFDLMQELGTDLMLVCSNVDPASRGGIDRAAADLRALGERAAARGLRVGFEALAWGRHVSDYRDAWEIVRRADHPAAGLILDSFHALAKGLPVEAITAIPGERIFLVQLADAPRLSLDILSWSRHFRCFPGQGELQLGAFMAAVEETGYAGPLSLEIFNDQFRAGSAGRVAVDGLRSLISLGQASPPAATCLGIEFIEFALDEEMAGALRQILAAMGFSLMGQHRSKQVEHWAQGDIHLVVNSERSGFAHTHFITHGPGVCAIGLRVADVDAAMRRAEALKVQTFRQPVGPGELEIPAIRGVGGSLLYFIDPAGPLGELWRRDFLPAPAENAGSTFLASVDHIAQSMPHDEMLSWLLFYESVFDLARTAQVDVADPAGLVQSRAVQSLDRSTRLVLNGSQANRTLASRFLSEFFGSGVQHMAFESRDIFASVAAMRKAGLELLDIPDNYYDDLEARYALAPEVMAALRSNGVLYDRDGDAEFFQVYTQVFAERFFFEVVQRRGYAGYGAANAPIRLSAQARAARPIDIPRD